ncbi:SDR family NAD(P)-dependent oxidoreductase [Actinacidiphila rubida]|uniref:NAD(P)-dependent dehydrogenase, short-chain alcohol dehydrogenase family n=1 Tax=Actinacidiphila rubida TaxID=310780 RepID=A0A1H8RZ68_9ACTN|nr:SDR family oxidoreductase [Actinacidiphila rubida]SEO71494.1 NAD(P)-dependent dehydrogenase, short-chain alcohol dehydrogenase family [Actinacidiphila rubida]
MSSIVVVGGTTGLGREVARFHAERGDTVVITGRDAERTDLAAKEIGAARGLALDLTRPKEIASALADVGRVDGLVLGAITRDHNTLASYDIDGALQLMTLKLVGYTATVHALHDRLHDDSSVVVFGGQAKERAYPGSISVSTVNAAVTGLVRALATELAPVRVNALHPGIVGDSPFWADKPLDAVTERTPTGRLASMADVVDAVDFLLRNRGINGVDLAVDGGWVLR